MRETDEMVLNESLRPRRPWGVLLGAALLSCGDVTPAGNLAARVELSPATLSLVVGRDTALRARVVLGFGTFQEPGGVFWSSADVSVATVDATGRVTAVQPGNTRIAASRDGKSAMTQLEVMAPPVSSVRVAPASSGITVGSTLTLRADPLFASGDPVPGRTIAWTTSTAAVASVTASGTVQAVAAGTATITATVDGVSGTAAITVSVVPVATVVTSPTTASLILSRTTQLTATTRAASGSTLTGRAVAWSTDAPTIAPVSATGLVTTLNTGTANISATSEGRRGTTRITVVPVPVRSVSILPPTVAILVGGIERLTAVPRDSAGTALPGRAVTWVSAQPTVASVDSTGLVTAIAPGTARITATSEGRSGVSTITVTQRPVATVTVAPATLNTAQGRALQLTATTLDAQGRVLTGRAVSWLSGSPSIAKVDANGLVSATAIGTVLIIATSEGQRGIATVVVR
ncbi:MAG: Ig-like domain-containing protein [Cytophagaceae bacterium]|nr:Ig-like domain-containing protein [Gemmatimonadaceae bacterium]